MLVTGETHPEKLRLVEGSHSEKAESSSEVPPEGAFSDGTRFLLGRFKELEARIEGFEKKYESVAQTQARRALMNLPSEFQIVLQGGKKKKLLLRYPSLGKVEYVMELFSELLENFWTPALEQALEADFSKFFSLLWAQYGTFRPKLYLALQYLFDPADMPDVNSLAVSETEVKSLNIAEVALALTEKFTPFVGTILPFLQLRVKTPHSGKPDENGSGD